MSNDMQNLMEEIEKSMVKLRRGEVITGKVIKITDNEITVNIGYKSDGIIPKEEISNDITVNPFEVSKEGDEIQVYVLNLDDGEGNVLLSKKRVDMAKGWDDIEKIKETESLVETKVVEAVKGGVIAVARGIRCFIPASHLSNHYVSDLKDFIGKNFNTKIIEFDRKRNKVVLSRKIVLEEENKHKKLELFSKLEKGMRIKGEIKRITDFGAFIDIGGIDGLVHISELSWGRIKHPEEVVSIGETVEVEVLDFNKEKEKIALSLKQTQPHPWGNVAEKYSIGSIVEGKVVRLVDFGAFVELELGLDGLVHISQISEKHISKPAEELHIGQKVQVKVLDVKPEEKRISLSMTAVNESAKLEQTEYIDEDNSTTIGDILENSDKK